MSDWVPAGSRPYDTIFAATGTFGQTPTGYLDGSEPYFSALDQAVVTAVRDPRQCVGNEHTCKGWKSQETDFCTGHFKASIKAAALAEAQRELVIIGGD